MNTLYFFLLLLGALSFLGAAFGPATAAGSDTNRGTRGALGALSLLPLGLLFWILVPLIEAARHAF